MPLDADWIRENTPGRQIVYFPITGSTMIEAARLAYAGAGAGTAVIAEEQTAGQGRHGRVWVSEPESGLYTSVILRFALGAGELPVLTMACGVAAFEAVRRTCGHSCDLRWPNDLLAEGRKCGGILVHLEGAAQIVGIGLNVNQVRFPEEVAHLATSLRLVLGAPLSRERLLLELLGSLDEFGRILQRSGRQAIFDLFAQRSSYVRGKRVVVELEPGRELKGVTDGLDEAGFLIVRTDSGARETVLAGGVRPAEGKE